VQGNISVGEGDGSLALLVIVARERFLEGRSSKYKFRCDPKLPSICINQNCSMGMGSYTFC